VDDGIGGDERAGVERVFRSSYVLVVRYCYRRVGDIQLSQELAQETFVVAWRRRRDMPAEALPWLYGIARRVLADHWRSSKSRPVTVPLAESIDLGGPDEALEAVALAQDLRVAFMRISEADREVIRLVTWEELDVAGVARVLGCSRAAAAVRIYRARQRLLGKLDPRHEALASREASEVRIRGGVR
jgi:RNA polymerase sigma factor (sigma-70 family)